MRWRVSDVFAALARDRTITTEGRDAAWWVAVWATQDMGHELTDATVGKWLRMPEAGVALRVNEREWQRMSDEQRCAAVVREAELLGVPRRAK